MLYLDRLMLTVSKTRVTHYAENTVWQWTVKWAMFKLGLAMHAEMYDRSDLLHWIWSYITDAF